jgi:hypothetical protein
MHGDSEGKVVPIAPEPSASSRPVAAAADSERSSGLDGRQIFFLFVGSAVFACLVFAIGVFVGRRLERGAAAQAAQQSASDPLAILDEIANAEESLTFHRALSSGTPSPRPARPATAAGQSADSGARPVLIGPPAPR